MHTHGGWAVKPSKPVFWLSKAARCSMVFFCLVDVVTVADSRTWNPNTQSVELSVELELFKLQKNLACVTHGQMVVEVVASSGSYRVCLAG